MDGGLSRSSAVCQRDWRVRTIVPGAQKYSPTDSKSVVLSGFPTAVEESLRQASPGTSAGALPSDRRASQLPLARDDIPR
jgi:hypothetical protein